MPRPAPNVVAVAVVTTVLVFACRAGEVPGPVEASAAPECPTMGERPCRQSADCGNGAHCTGGRCWANQAGCPCSSDEDGDCGANAHCTRGQCYANEAGNPCSKPEHCGPRAHCTVDTCYPNASGSPCQEDSDCGPSSACVSGKCN